MVLETLLCRLHAQHFEHDDISNFEKRACVLVVELRELAQLVSTLLKQGDALSEGGFPFRGRG